MIDSYWDLYVAYIDKCVRGNRINGIDPHRYKMEWNHFLPRCVFGEWPIGHYLTLEQHAIASALQTLSFKKNCMCGWHKKYIPENLLDLAWPYYRHASKQVMAKVLSEKDERGKCVVAVRAGKASAACLKEKTDDSGRSLLEVKAEKMRKIAQMVNEVKHAQRDEHGRSIAGKTSNFAKQARPIKVTKLETGETFEFANSVDAGLSLGLIPRSLRKVASGERNSVYGYTAEFTDSK
jgi:hypothetical protein